jgi:ABC-type sugar transport system ATPase subunit
MSAISLNTLRKSYDGHEIVHGIDLDIEDGEFVVFVGPSGCGKSTLLKMIAGLEEISSGDIRIGGRSVRGVPPAKRGIAMVFQYYALYPHMRVYDNIAFGLKIAGLGKPEIDKRVREAARILQLETLLDRYPRQLSGGQRQRVAIGRAIAREPQVLLFDEPLSNLDAALRGQTRVEIGRLHQALKSTIIYVTHDQVEAMTLADRIVLLNEGRIEQVGSPLDLYENPANLFVARFLGSPGINLIPAASLGRTDAETIGIRPERIQLTPDQPGAKSRGIVELVEHLGDTSLVHLELSAGGKLIVKLSGVTTQKRGEKVGLSWANKDELRFDARGNRIRAGLVSSTGTA